MENFYSTVINNTNPESTVQEYCTIFIQGELSTQLLLVNYPFTQYWLEHESLPEAESTSSAGITLSALYFLSKSENTVDIQVAVCDDFELISSRLHQSTEIVSEKSFSNFCARFSMPCFSANQLLKLKPVSIAKPWGREIWYTGIEQRGVAMATANGMSTPLPWVLSALPETFCKGQQQSLILLKILDPLPDKKSGDLYFELHQEKREVYVVTSISDLSWPSGKGAMRFGFNQHKRNEYEGDEEFKAAFLKSVKSYEYIRRKIDSKRDRLAQTVESSGGEIVGDDIEIPDSWLVDELKLQQQMEGFTGQLELVVGDVVTVPCLTPHSLLHGVRTVEFQTPVYERLIISFNQKVTTQDHWDTEAAIELMDLEDVKQESSTIIATKPGLEVEKIVEFKDFFVLRVKLQSFNRYIIDSIESYCLIMAIEGDIIFKGETLLPEEAAILAREANGGEIRVQSTKSACFLLAYPK